MTFRLSARSRANLDGVHPDLVRVIERAIQITPIDFAVIEGLRSEERQRELVRSGASKTLNSRHLTGHAVDVVPWVDGTASWHWPHYDVLAPAIKQAAADVGVPVEWGGDWSRFRDGPHWQLPWAEYPKGAPMPPDVEPISEPERSKPMTWDKIQQVVRIVLYAAGGYVFGDAVVEGDTFQQAVGGLLSVGAFVWWYVWDRKREA